MPTTVVKTIGSGGGRDYSTPQSWEDDTDNTSLVTADEIRQGELYNDSEFTFTTDLTIGGATTDSTRYRVLTVASGQSFRDHANKLTNALKYNVSNGVGIKTTTGFIGLLTISENYSRASRIQFSQPSGSYSIGISPATATSEVRDCIYEGIRGYSGVLGKIVNCLHIKSGAGLNGGFSLTGSGANNGACYNCTSVVPTGVSTTGTGFVRAAYTNPTIKNCASFGWATAFTSSGWGSATYSATDAATAPGTSNQTSLTYANQFEGVTSGAPDFRVKSGSSLANNGTPDSSNTNDLDIIGQSRSTSTPTIGAWEFVSGGSAVQSTFSAKAGLRATSGSQSARGVAVSAKAGTRGAVSGSKSVAIGLSAIAGAIGSVSGKKAATAGISAISGLLAALETTTPGTSDFNAITGALVSITHSTARLSTIQARAGALGNIAGVHRATRALQAIAGAVASIEGPPDDNRVSSFAAIAGAAAALSKTTARIASLAAKAGLLGRDTVATIRAAQIAAIAGLKATIAGINVETAGKLLTVSVSARAAYGCALSEALAFGCSVSSQPAYHCTVSEAIVQ